MRKSEISTRLKCGRIKGSTQAFECAAGSAVIVQ